MYQITVAVAGTGFIGPVHVEALKRLGIRVKGILGSTPQKSERARQHLNLETAYVDYQAILEDAEVEAVHLAVPNVLHYEMALEALHKGKHVMCEKPLAMTSEESATLCTLAKESGLTAGVCYNIRFYPLNLELQHMIAQGDLGKITAIQGSYVQDWLLYQTDYNWRVLADKGGALRAVADIGTHWIDLITTLTGLEVEAVFADLHQVYATRKRPLGEVATYSGEKLSEDQLEAIDIDTEDAGSILFRFKGDAKANLWVSQVTAGRKNCLRYEISGTQASASWNSESPNTLLIGKRDEANQALLKDPGLLSAEVRPFANYPGGHNEGFPDTFKQCFRAFYDAINHKLPAEKAPYPTFEQGHKEVLLCEAILKSHQEERWISV